VLLIHRTIVRHGGKGLEWRAARQTVIAVACKEGPPSLSNDGKLLASLWSDICNPGRSDLMRLLHWYVSPSWSIRSVGVDALVTSFHFTRSLACSPFIFLYTASRKTLEI
jgi:hypothetical protein